MRGGYGLPILPKMIIFDNKINDKKGESLETNSPEQNYFWTKMKLGIWQDRSVIVTPDSLIGEGVEERGLHIKIFILRWVLVGLKFRVLHLRINYIEGKSMHWHKFVTLLTSFYAPLYPPLIYSYVDWQWDHKYSHFSEALQ